MRPLSKQGEALMARSYAKLLVAVWRNEDFTRLTASAQRTYMLLVSHPALSHAGCIPLQPKRWSMLAADTTPLQLEADIVQLADARFVHVDDDTEEVLVRSFIKHDGGWNNPNISKAIASAIEAIDSPALRTIARSELAKAQGTGPDQGPSGRPSQGPTEGDRQSTYIHHPESFIPHPSSAGDSEGPSGPVASTDDDGSCVDRIISHIADLRVQAKNPERPDSYRRTVIDNLNRTERQRIAEMLVEMPFYRDDLKAGATRYELGYKTAVAS